MEDVIEFMRHTHLFKGFNRDELEAVAALLVEKRIGPEEHILAEKETSCSLYLIRQGQVKISIGYPLHLKEDLPIRTLGPGEMFGEFAFVDQLPRSASALTLTETRVLTLSREDYEGLAASRPDIALSLLQNIAVTLTEQIRDITTLWRDSI